MPIEIPLANGGSALIDEADCALVDGFRWRVQRHADGHPYCVVAKRRGAAVLLHRLIMGAKHGECVDHINRDVLDNTRGNLRICSHAENMRNRRRSKHNKSGFKGVYRDREKWRASIRVNGDKFCLGSFDTPELAHEAYCLKAIELHGEFARFS